MKILKSFSTEKKEANHYNETSKTLRNLEKELWDVIIRADVIFSLFDKFKFATMMCYGGYFVLEGVITPGQL